MEPESTAASELVVPTPPGWLKEMALGSGTFTIAGVFMFYVAQSPELGGVHVPQAVGLLLGALGLVVVLFSIACGAYALFRLAKPTPAVIINRKGITDNASAIGVGFIPWSQVVELREYRFLRQAFLGVVPKDLESLITRLPAWKRVAIRANRLFGFTPINIPQSILPMSVSQLLREIDAHYRVLPDA
jgi:hypothetical protein